MFVVRPKNIKGTPFAVAHDLGCQTRFYPNEKRVRRFDFRTDFFMVPVTQQQVTNAPDTYVDFLLFAAANKYGQRKRLEAAGIPVPRVAGSTGEASELGGSQYVVRPLRHSRSQHYRVTENRLDFVAGKEYISELYPKRREYRVIFVFGKPLIWLRKKPNEGIDEAAPWGHLNSRFQTIHDIPNCKLTLTDCVDRLSAFAPIRGSHICAADVLYNSKEKSKYVVLELNFCPALDIDNNREKVVAAIQGRSQASNQ
jgi:hypothetical protein